MAGEVLAVGDEVKGWKAGDRVSSNFWTYLGDHSDEIYATSLGGQSPGVLTQYRNFPAQVRSTSLLSLNFLLIQPRISPWFVSLSTLPTSKHRLYRKYRGPTK
jgi:NADPH:quinone reductase-like Zn-dependent oxidoreductase